MMFGGGMGFGFGWLVMVLFWVFLIAGTVWLVVAPRGRSAAGPIAAISGLALLVAALLMGVAGAGWSGGFPGGSMGPAMMGGWSGAGTSPSSGAGPFGMGPGMMGAGHMGWAGGRPRSAAPTEAPIAGAPTVRVTAADLRFEPAEIRLPSGAAVNLTLANTGRLPHDLTVPKLGIQVVAAAGETRTAGLRDLAPGRYDAYCSVPGHADAGMRTIVVVE